MRPLRYLCSPRAGSDAHAGFAFELRVAAFSTFSSLESPALSALSALSAEPTEKHRPPVLLSRCNSLCQSVTVLIFLRIKELEHFSFAIVPRHSRMFFFINCHVSQALSTTRGCGREDHLCCASRVPGLRCLLPSKAAALLLPKCLLLHHHRFRRCRLRVAQHVPLRAAQVPPAGS